MSKQQIIYIGGYGRSGSTLLDIMLGDIYPNVGEVVFLPVFAAENNVQCTCGHAFRDCIIWSKVLAEYPDKNSLQLLDEIFKKNGKLSAIIKAAIFSILNRADTHRDTFTRFYSAIFKAVNSNIIVESTKTSGHHYFRPIYLHVLCGYDIKLIHLVRDPRAVYSSRKKRKNVLVDNQEPAKISFVWIKTAISWYLSNLAAMLARLVLGANNYLLVRYEDLVSNPRVQLEKIGAFLAVDMGHIVKKICDDASFSPNHLVAGNRMARRGAVKLKREISWHREMPAWKQAVTWLVQSPLAAYFGYRIIEPPHFFSFKKLRNE